jgi:hypothetical protein
MDYVKIKNMIAFCWLLQFVSKPILCNFRVDLF